MKWNASCCFLFTKFCYSPWVHCSKKTGQLMRSIYLSVFSVLSVSRDKLWKHWTTERKKWLFICEIWVIDQMWDQDGWILARFFFCVFLDQGEVEVLKHSKKKENEADIQPSWLRTSLIHKGFITWVIEPISCGTQRLMKSGHHLARSSSQSQSRMWFILVHTVR